MVNLSELKCPGCSGTLTIPHEFSRVVTCPYCGLISKIHSGALDPTGKFARLTPSRSKISIGMKFSHQSEEYTIKGRIRYQYDEGYWDEWWAVSESNQGWLEEDEGSLLLWFSQKLTSKVPSFDTVSVGSSFELNSKEFFVTEKNTARVVGSEGELSEVYMPDVLVKCVDGAYDNQSGALEYWEDEISFSRAVEVKI